MLTKHQQHVMIGIPKMFLDIARRQAVMKPTNRVRELRLRRDLTQEELAKLVGSSQGNISKIESGRNDLMDADLIVKLSRALRVQPWELFVEPEAPAVHSAVRASDCSACSSGSTNSFHGCKRRARGTFPLVTTSLRTA